MRANKHSYVMCNDQLLLYSDAVARTKKYLGYLPGHGSQFSAADWGKCCCNALL